MIDITNILMQIIAENRVQVKYLKNQCIYLTSLIVIMALIIHLALFRIGFNKNSLAYTMLLIVFGTYGMLAGIKLNNQTMYHINILRELHQGFNEEHSNAEKQTPKRADGNKQKTEHSIITKYICYLSWLGLFILITVLGIIYTVIILR